MSYIKFSLLNLLIFFTFSLSVHAENNDAALIKTMQDGGHILMIRHAKAPGFGDPDTIKIEDCSTQRNLDENGRQQSVNIGNWLRNNKIEISDIYSSQWCRCLETARLLNLGSVKELPALNSFFQMPENREPSLSALKQFIAAQATNKKLIIMVTHHVTIAAISGQNVASGDGVLLKLNASEPFEFVGIFNPE
ncbi:histidine phosphatase family protein [Cocleimonas flava]|uniref:Histidine phosphatase superfamily protein (Branch 1) n=1 Tax=Cocleimonas flava TaxID=634765 RepID=A0A4R1F0P6_9GAMM|nr:histidine phosphatase family protein [Cocleimonas flava]TCJ87797.1 histidine phosphatase superfamily protein (branch 1) [Cocleimonas flava]